MRRISILCAVLIMFVLGTTSALAKGPKEGKGNKGGGKGKDAAVKEAAEKGKAPTAKEAEAGEDKVKAEKRKAEKQAKATKEKAEDEAEEAKEEAEKKAEKAKKEKGKAKDKDDDDKAAGKGKGENKGKSQKDAARAKQFEREAAKHETRKARLAEMLKVAEGKSDEKAVGRIQKLIDREQSRFEKKNKKMTERSSKKEAADDADED
jgi:hypothetical protein